MSEYRTAFQLADDEPLACNIPRRESMLGLRIKRDHDRIRELEAKVERLRTAVHFAAHEAHTSGRIYALRNGKEGCSRDVIQAIARCAEKHIAEALEGRDDG